MAWKTRSWLLGLFLLLFSVGCFIVQPALHLAGTWWNDKDEVTPACRIRGRRQSPERNTRRRSVECSRGAAAAEQQLRELLQARHQGLRVAIAGTKHTMGGHTIYPDGIVLNMLPFNRSHLDTQTKILTVALSRWSEIVPYLDKHGCSVAVMQASNSFSVGGSLSQTVMAGSTTIRPLPPPSWRFGC